MHRLTPIVIALLAGMALWTSTAVAQNETIARGGFFGANCTVYPAWFKESFLELADDVAEAAANGKRIMLIFHQDGCPYCNRLIEVNLAQRDIEQYLRRNFDVVALNMWGDREVVSVGGETYTEKAFAQASLSSSRQP
jgi:thioredoxin-related protein